MNAPTLENDDRFHDVLAEYLRLVDQGEDVDQAAFLSAHPEYAAALAEYFEGASAIEEMAGPRIVPASAQGTVHRQFDAETSTDGSRPGTKRLDSQDKTAVLDKSDEPIPETFGRYQILRALGQGAMGAVYLAQDTQLERQVALKIPKFSGGASADLLTRFYREARAAARLRHPNICPVFDVGQIDGRHYITMAFIEGHSLREFAQSKKRQPEKQVAVVVRKLALGLAEAHAHGIIHRDLKPANIMVDKKGEPVVMDFGLARREEGDDRHMTREGAILGTPAYMSPEQVEGDQSKIGPPADIYSLGVVMYELLTGQVPFAGSLMSILTQIAAEQPRPPSLHRPGLDGRLEAICLKMMAKQADERYRSMDEVAQALAEYLAVGHASGLPSVTSVGQAYSLPLHDPPKVEASATWKRAPRPSLTRIPPRAWLAIGGGLAGVAVLFAAVTLFLRLGNVDVKVVIHDENLAVKFGKQTVTIENAGAPIRLKPGERKFVVEKDGLIAETDNLVVKNDGKTVLEVYLVDGQVVVSKDGDRPLVKRDPEPAIDKDGWHGWPKDAPPPAIAPFDANQALTHQEAWATYLNVPLEYTNSIGMKFRLIPPGEFTRGGTLAEIEEALKVVGDNKHFQEYIKSEAPQHKVILTQSVYLGVHEVTQGQFEHVIGRNPSHFKSGGAGKDAVAGMNTSSHPVEHATWNDAAEFCANLSQQEQLKPFYLRAGERVTPLDGSGYRLPTEAEWEYACRAGTTTRYWIGDKDEDLPQVAWFGKNSGGRTHAVGELVGNPFGLYDVHGNVVEWSQDGWEPTYERQFKGMPALDPHGPSAADSQRVIRGGSWNGLASYCRASFRYASTPAGRHSNFGFRAALPVDAVQRAIEDREARLAGVTPSMPEASLPSLDRELLKNPGCEEPMLDFEIPGWEQVKGRWRKGGLNRAMRAYEGQAFFSTGKVPLAELAQTVDISPYAQAIDAGRQQFKFWAYVRCYDQENPDKTRVIVEYRDAAGGKILDRYDSGLVKSVKFWRPLSDTRLAPVGTRSIRVRLVSIRTHAEANDGYFDGLSLRAVTESSGGTASPGPDRRAKIRSGKWKVEQEELVQTDAVTDDCRLYFGDAGWTDYDFSFEAVKTAGAFGVAALFRARDPRNYLVFDLAGWQNRKYAVECFVDGKHNWVKSDRPGKMEPRKKYQVRVEARGDHFRCFVDGELIYDFRDNRQDRGGVGFRCWGGAVRLGSIRVTAPGGGVLWEGMPDLSGGAAASSVDLPRSAIAPFDAKQAQAHQKAWARHLGVPVEYTNSLGMKFRLIPPGEFMRGIAPQELDSALKLAGGDKIWQDYIKSESPQHKVILTKPVYLGVHEVTQENYEAVMGKNPANFAKEGTGKDAVAGLETGNLPVDTVSWNDAAEFCAKLSEKEKHKPVYSRSGQTVTMLSGTGYRLPTEAEWELACRAGTTTNYSTGEKDEDLAQAGWFSKNSAGRTHAGGELKVNPFGLHDLHPFGLHDLHGNVWEWVQDAWEPGHYTQFKDKPALDPTGPTSGGSQRIIRGGSWHTPAILCRASSRHAFNPAEGGSGIGFRAALSVEAVKQALGARQGEPTSAIDLLKLVDVDRDAVHGKWTLTPEGLASDGSVPFCRLKFPYKPPAEYDFRIEFTAAGGNDVLQLLTAHGQDFTWLMGAWGGRYDGFDTVKGHPLIREGTNIVGGPSSIRRGQRHTSVLEVRRNYVSALIDGKLVVRHETDGADLGMPGEWSIGKSTIGLGTTHDAVVFHKAEIILPAASNKSAAWHGWPKDAPPPAIAPFDAKQAKEHQAAWAAYLKVPVEFTNSAGMKFRLIPPGEFMMGSTPAEVDAALKFAGESKEWQEFARSEAPRHKVILSQPWYLATLETSQRNYELLMAKNPAHFSTKGGGAEQVASLDTKSHPVEVVSWHDAAEFCLQLSEREKLRPTYSRTGEATAIVKGNGYRLPTEAEWEFACRAGTSTRFWSGDQDEDLRRAGWFGDDSKDRTHAGGELAANPFGLFDMHGNVWEWVQDGWDAGAYAPFAGQAAVDPSGPTALGTQRVVRGGRWFYRASFCRSSQRFAYDAALRASYVGFRVALPVDAVREALRAAKEPAPDREEKGTVFPGLSASALYVFKQKDKFQAVSDELGKLAGSSKQDYRVVVLPTFGDYRTRSSVFMHELAQEWQEQARERKLEFKAERLVLIVLAMNDSQLQMYFGPTIRDSLALDGPPVTNDLLTPHFLPFARQGRMSDGLVSLIRATEKWIAEHEPARDAPAKE